ncbi:uncharacterized protein A4U43_C06F10320 [Asparagus officinalis]|uniref:Uncharacterized protein n=1 Tax=Asparagus officinalis TaxID=4686 RepID=A0A5P1ENA7_ASPOF|nr:uncharacterized protein A4U43_C06F10320 [Asparagus officinalis]
MPCRLRAAGPTALLARPPPVAACPASRAADRTLARRQPVTRLSPAPPPPAAAPAAPAARPPSPPRPGRPPAAWPPGLPRPPSPVPSVRHRPPTVPRPRSRPLLRHRCKPALPGHRWPATAHGYRHPPARHPAARRPAADHPPTTAAI